MTVYDFQVPTLCNTAGYYAYYSQSFSILLLCLYLHYFLFIALSRVVAHVDRYKTLSHLMTPYYGVVMVVVSP